MVSVVVLEEQIAELDNDSFANERHGSLNLNNRAGTSKLKLIQTAASWISLLMRQWLNLKQEQRENFET